MRTMTIVLSAALLTGCAPTLVTKNDAGGMIRYIDGFGRDEKAFALADAHCRQFGKAAQVNQTDILSNTMTFNCVVP